jgi:hypothetical protein
MLNTTPREIAIMESRPVQLALYCVFVVAVLCLPFSTSKAVSCQQICKMYTCWGYTEDGFKACRKAVSNQAGTTDWCENCDGGSLVNQDTYIWQDCASTCDLQCADDPNVGPNPTQEASSCSGSP